MTCVVSPKFSLTSTKYNWSRVVNSHNSLAKLDNKSKMADSAPSKNDIQLVFKKLRAISTNKVCFDCSAKNPTWSSVTYGVFICIDCSAVHRSLGVHLTFVRSTQLDTNWTWLQLRQMQIGGNANADLFFRQHNCITTDAQQKYNSRAAQLYREKLHTAAVHAMRLHGTKLDVDIRADGSAKTLTSLYLEPIADTNTSENKKDVDFFEEHTATEESEVNQNNLVQNINNLSTNGSVNLSGSNASIVAELSAMGKGPNVDGLLNSSGMSNERKPTIGTRKPAAKRTGLGSKKGGGLGAQRVKANFADIEREAELADQLRSQESVNTLQPEKTPEEQEAQITSMRLAYEDLSIQQKKKEEKLKALDPKKAEQIERLGMGFFNRSGISHSALSDMKTIEQETPLKSTNNSRSMFDRDSDGGCDDFFDCAGSTTSTFSMYKGNRMSTESSNIDSLFYDPVRDHMNCSTDITSKISSIGSNKQRWGDFEKNTGSKSKTDWGEPERRQPTSVTSSTDKKTQPVSSSSSNEAQKKFGSAKAISSDQYFSDSKDTDWERKTNLARFEGSSSISSADYFGRSEPGGATSGYTSSIQAPDLEDVKESVRQGVTKVAGKLSSLANGVMSSIQERYGGY